MAQVNGRSVYDLITEGSSRTIQSMNGHDTPGISIPREEADRLNISIGDDVAIKPSDTQDNVLELHFATDE